MKKPDFIAEVAFRSDISREKAGKIISNIEDIVLEAIALEDEVSFSFAKIGGHVRKRTKYWNPNANDYCYCEPKSGYPYCKFTPKAKA